MFDIVEEKDIHKVFSTRALVYVITHGETEGQGSERLSEKGQNQIAELARSRVATGVHAIFTSTMKEAAATAEILAKEFGVTVESRPCLVDAAISKGRPSPRQLADRLPIMWDDVNHTPIGGESFNVARRRFGDCMNYVGEKSVGDTVAVVTHPLIAALFLSMVKGGGPILEDWLYMGHASCATYEYSSGGWSLVMPPDDSYLSETTSVADMLPRDLLHRLHAE
jgi:broad specificity phosphatase PhoE